MAAPSMKGPMLLTALALAMAAIILALMVFAPQEGTIMNALSAAWGFVTKLVADSWNWFFGTTKGSEAKTDLLAQSLPIGYEPPAPVAAAPLAALPPDPARDPVNAEDLTATPFGGR